MKHETSLSNNGIHIDRARDPVSTLHVTAITSHEALGFRRLSNNFFWKLLSQIRVVGVRRITFISISEKYEFNIDILEYCKS